MLRPDRVVDAGAGASAPDLMLPKTDGTRWSCSSGTLHRHAWAATLVDRLAGAAARDGRGRDGLAGRRTALPGAASVHTYGASRANAKALDALLANGSRHERAPDQAAPTFAVGVDIGGSKVLAVAVDDDAARCVATHRLPSNGGAAGVVASAPRGGRPARPAPRRTGVRRSRVVGVGVPGLVQPHSRRGHARGEPRRRPGHAEPGRASRGAARRAGRGGERRQRRGARRARRCSAWVTRDLAFLSIGTGLAAGLVIDGRLRRGARGAAGEIGHIPVDPAGPLVLVRAARLPGDAGVRLGDRRGVAVGDGVSPGTALFAAAASGDPQRGRGPRRVRGAVAAAVRLLVLTCDVEVVVLGGGVTDVGAALLDAVVAALGSAGRGLAVPHGAAAARAGGDRAARVGGGGDRGRAGRDLGARRCRPGWVDDAASRPA